jgi:nitroreductase
MSQTLDQQKHEESEVPVEDLFLRRWSPQAFSDTLIDSDTLKAIFSAAQWAASSFHDQLWRFVVGRKCDSVWQRILEFLAPPNQSWVKAAPVLFPSFAQMAFSQNDATNRVSQHDVVEDSAQISLEAAILGLHTHGMVSFDSDRLATSLGVPNDLEAIACWALGCRGDPETHNEQQ